MSPIRRTLAVLTLLAVLPSAGLAAAQDLVLRSGPVVAPNPVLSSSMSPYAALGARVWLSNLFQVQGALGFDEGLTTEVSLYARPYNNARYEPYFFAGVGPQFGADETRGVVPVGAGVQYQMNGPTALFAELSARWLVERGHDPEFRVAPVIGAAYQLSARPAPPRVAERVNVGQVGGDFAVSSARVDRVEDAEGREGDARPAAGSPERAASSAAPGAPARQPVSFDYDWERPGSDPEDLGDRVRLRDGTFMMGLTDEDPLRLQAAGIRRVTVSSFILDKHEVSNGDYKQFLQDLSPEERAAMQPDQAAWDRAGSASSFEEYFQSGAFDEYPVVAVTWHQATRYCEAQGGRLPTEAEWEYAARGGVSGGIFPWPGYETRATDGSYLANYNPRGFYAADGYAFTAPVTAFPPNPWGLHNMAGNVAEWVTDTYTSSLQSLSNFNPVHEDAEESRRVVRGGSWASDDFYIGVGVRDVQEADESSLYTGFRCAYDIGRGSNRQQNAAPTQPAPVQQNGGSGL